MKTLTKSAWVIVLALVPVLFHMGCEDPNDSYYGDSDSDSDSESDTGTGPDPYECTAPEGITDWGGPCHGNADCPPNTECLILSSMDQTQAFCAPECCTVFSNDPTYCTDVAAGQKYCIYPMPDEPLEFLPPFYCVIICNTQADCPSGTACTDAGVSTSICYGYAS